MELDAMYRGDTRIFKLTSGTDLTGSTLYFTVKAKDTDPDAQALVDKTFDLGAPDAEGRILTALVEVAPEESSQFPAGSADRPKYVAVGVEMTTPDGKNYTLFNDVMPVIRDVRQTLGAPA